MLFSVLLTQRSTRRDVELEVEEEGCQSSQEGHQPFHQGTLRVQGKTCLQNREGVRNEEVEGVIELSISGVGFNMGSFGGWSC